MKWVFQRDELREALSAVVAVMPSKSARPILRHLYLSCTADGMAEVLATDQEVGLRCRFGALSVSEAGRVVLLGQTLAGLVGGAGSETLELEVGGDSATLRDGPAKFDLPCLEAEDFPRVADLECGGSTELPAKVVAKMIDETSFAAAREPARFAINGVYLLLQGKQIEMVATDGHRLANSRRKLKKKVAEETAVIVPLKTMTEVRRACERLDEEANIYLGVKENSILWRTDCMTITSVLVEGSFPKYQDVVPKDCDKAVVIPRGAFIAGLSQAVLMTSEETRAVSMKVARDKLIIDSRAADRGAAYIPLEVKYDGEELEIAFDPRYILEALRVMEGEEITLELKDRTKPGVIRRDGEFTYVVMPVRMRD